MQQNLCCVHKWSPCALVLFSINHRKKRARTSKERHLKEFPSAYLSTKERLHKFGLRRNWRIPQQRMKLVEIHQRKAIFFFWLVGSGSKEQPDLLMKITYLPVMGFPFRKAPFPWLPVKSCMQTIILHSLNHHKLSYHNFSFSQDTT